MAAITTDGSDIDGCSNVVVRGCDFDAEDDAICLTSTDRLCENVLVENCRVRSSCYGLKMGTASHGGFRRITMPGGADPAVAYISLDELHRVSDFPERYPEFAMFAELPAWVLCLRHTRGILLRQSRFDLRFPDFRPAPVLDTSVDTALDGISLDLKSDRPLIAAHARPAHASSTHPNPSVRAISASGKPNSPPNDGPTAADPKGNSLINRSQLSMPNS